MRKRTFSMLLCFCLFAMLLPTAVFAEETDNTDTTQEVLPEVVPSQYNVTFATECGTTPASMTVTEGTVITLPELGNDGDNAFVGWWILDSSPDFGFYSAGEEYEVSRDVTFVAEWNEIITLSAPFSTTVELGDSGVPDATMFTLEVALVNAAIEGGDHIYKDVTVSASVTTNGRGNYDGTMTFTGPSGQIRNMLTQGVYVQQVDNGKENWTYDDTVWYLILAGEPEVSALTSTYDEASKYKVLIFQAICEQTENGPVYKLDWDNMNWEFPETKMLFTNIYTAHDYTLKHNETEHWNECDCGDVQNKEAHQYGEWTVTKEASKTENGEKEHTCIICGYTEKVQIEKLSVEEKNQETDKTDTKKKSPKTSTQNNIVLWISIMLAAGVALIGTGICALKKKYNR